MNKMTYLILALALASIACLQTSLVTNPVPAPVTVPAMTLSATQETEIESGAVFETDPAPSETAMPMCGEVTAAKAVNLRAGPTEHSRVLTWLPAGTMLEVIERGTWWNVTSGEYVGYVRDLYVREAECQP